jgi:D-glycero-alpha-D-manno-heptose 1-phosphate guanylyltransferase
MQKHLNEAIILAGGLGTRLRSVLPDLPKAMAPVAGRPFLSWILDRIIKQGISRVILSIGYRHESIIDHVLKNHAHQNIVFCVEDEPLGTGGGIRKACQMAVDEHVLVLNGDTFFDVDLVNLNNFHLLKNTICTLSLKPMKDFDRYGIVEIDEKGEVTGFREKQACSAGLINGGVYLLDRNQYLSQSLPGKFSFEKDYLEPRVSKQKFYGFRQDGYFIDIGTLEDYERAQLEIPALF